MPAPKLKPPEKGNTRSADFMSKLSPEERIVRNARNKLKRDIKKANQDIIDEFSAEWATIFNNRALELIVGANASDWATIRDRIVGKPTERSESKIDATIEDITVKHIS